MGYPYDRDIDAETELRRWDYRAERYYDMRRLGKTQIHTFSNGSGLSIPDSDLDHVYASEHLQFKTFSGAEVDVRGWVNETTQAKQDKWISEFSDHCLLYLEVQKVG